MLAIIFAIMSSTFEPLPDYSWGIAPFLSEVTPFLARDTMRSPLAKAPLACFYISVVSKEYLGELKHKEHRLREKEEVKREVDVS